MKSYQHFLVIFALLLSTSVFGDDGKANFSGVWSFDKEKSVLEQAGRYTPAKLKIVQSDSLMTVERTYERENEDDFVYEEKLTLDSTECVNWIFDFPKKSVVTWSEDGKQMTVTSHVVFERDGQEFEMDTVDIFSLKEDDLSVEFTSKSPRRERKGTLIYSKVEDDQN